MLAGEQNENGIKNLQPQQRQIRKRLKLGLPGQAQPIHIMDWAQAQWEDPMLEATLEWCLNDKKKGTPWAQQLEKLKAHLGSLKNQPEGRCIVRNADKLTLLGGMLYH